MSGAGGANVLAEDLEHILAHTSGLWEPLRHGRIFVTGGTGFFGRWLLESFRHVNERLGLETCMVVLSRDPEAFGKKAPHLVHDEAIDFLRGDVRDLTAASVIEQLGAGSDRFDFAIHAATEASAKLNAENPLAMISTIVDGTRAALEFAVATGAKRFLLTSSGAVYGRQPSNLTHIPEDYNGAPDCNDPASAYGEAKRTAELLCACYHRQHGLEPLIARCFAFVGPFLPLDTHFAIGNFIGDALKGGPIRVKGDGSPRRTYLYAADLVIWLWTILIQGQPGRPYNVGSAHDLTISDLAYTVGAATSGEVRVSIEGILEPRIPPCHYVPDTARARGELGLRESVDLVEAIKRTARSVDEGVRERV